mmetsp:Transcript_22884/g.28444  ORF Transcript_22884/g.28444 Transcript_22884/m.28444 type:complete len:101 (-) Transcript_22884:306-608(-)
MFQLFANTSCIEFTFTLTSFATDPFETIVGEELGHLGNLCFVVITLNREVGNLVNTVLTCRHRQLLILVLQVLYLAGFLREFFLERSVHRFKLGEASSHR